MINISGGLMAAGNIHWQSIVHPPGKHEEAMSINFHFHRLYDENQCYFLVSEVLKDNNVDWLIWDKKYWMLSADKIKEYFTFLEKEEWLYGNLVVAPKVSYSSKETYIRFEISSTEVTMQTKTRIFLSHKGIDKQLVRRFKTALESFNYKPWLDEDHMKAGDELERALLRGFTDSCAAVFFITPNYGVEGYLATEINHALQEKRDKGDKFSIITLNLPDEHGNFGEIPRLLRQYVWKEPNNEIEALTEIVKALPIESPYPVWKHNA